MADDDDARTSASPHATVDNLADLDEGLLDADRTAALEGHLAGCAACTDQLRAVREVGVLLGSIGPVTMPVAVAERLSGVLQVEQQRRTVHRAATPTGGTLTGGPYASTHVGHGGGVDVTVDSSGGKDHRTSLGTFGGTPAPRKSLFERARFLVPVAAALALAAGVGFGGYVLSASTGLHEPTVAGVVQVQSAELGPEAAELARRSDLDAYAFTQAWRCAGRLVEGRITGLVPAYVDGRRSLLVYTRDDGRRVVTVVRGCPDPGPDVTPSAGPSAVLPR